MSDNQNHSGVSERVSGGVRLGETTVPLPPSFDAGLYFIGRIRSPWRTPAECPHRGDMTGPLCQLEFDSRWSGALSGLELRPELQILYFMHLSRRDLTRQAPRRRPEPIGTFALRSPARPNPIASSRVALVAVEGCVVHVRGLDCIDGTPLIDVKPVD